VALLVILNQLRYSVIEVHLHLADVAQLVISPFSNPNRLFSRLVLVAYPSTRQNLLLGKVLRSCGVRSG
jgi:hypothetical protein